MEQLARPSCGVNRKTNTSSFTTASGKETHLTAVELDGRYQLEHLPAGEAEVEATARLQRGDEIRSRAQIEFGEGAAILRDLDLTEGGSD
jgi:hypothetical protein